MRSCTAVLRLRQKLDVPHTLRDFKVGAENRDLIGDMAIVDPTAGGNPVELTKELALEIFDAGDGGAALAPLGDSAILFLYTAAHHGEG